MQESQRQRAFVVVVVVVEASVSVPSFERWLKSGRSLYAIQEKKGMV